MTEIKHRSSIIFSAKWPFTKMEVGDIVDYPILDDEFRYARSACQGYGARTNKKFTCHKMINKNGVKITRIWRIE